MKNQLQKYEQVLRAALRYNYVRPLSRQQWEEIARLYKELSGEPVEPNPRCSSCRLQFLKKVANFYFSHG